MLEWDSVGVNLLLPKFQTAESSQAQPVPTVQAAQVQQPPWIFKGVPETKKFYIKRYGVRKEYRISVIYKN